jgi:hypothetical protein
MEEKSPLVWNGYGGPEGKSYTGTGFAYNWSALCSSLKIFTRKGRPPRIHDLRHYAESRTMPSWITRIIKLLESKRIVVLMGELYSA